MAECWDGRGSVCRAKCFYYILLVVMSHFTVLCVEKKKRYRNGDVVALLGWMYI
jgi:hypothetical protein